MEKEENLKSDKEKVKKYRLDEMEMLAERLSKITGK